MKQAALREHLLARIQSLWSQPVGFEEVALALFRYQARYNPLFAEWLALLDCRPERVRSLDEVPFLPIQFFKTHEVKTGSWTAEAIFGSSGTTGSTVSRHHVRSLDFYLKNAVAGFSHFYGPPEEYRFLALLPGYLERPDSSLVAMVHEFIRRSPFEDSRFFLHDQDALVALLRKYEADPAGAPPTILFGVSFALLDLAETHRFRLPSLIVVETGGMKGRRREPTREELHSALGEAFGVELIHSEYGMTELLSQAWSKGHGRFTPAPTLRVHAREITDPLAPQAPGRTGVLHLIDLANIDSCAFIATEDLGRVFADGSFEVLGRMDNSDMRGCNLMVADHGR